MVMAVGLRPDEDVGPVLRGTDVEIRVARIVTQEVEMKQLVLPDCYATVLDGAIVRRESLCVDEETADNSYEVCAHGILPSMPGWHFLPFLLRK
jgi:hypothetical protein